jgi:hypothetical protein
MLDLERGFVLVALEETHSTAVFLCVCVCARVVARVRVERGCHPRRTLALLYFMCGILREKKKRDGGTDEERV